MVLKAGATLTTDNKYGVELANGSRVLALPSSEESIRGLTVDGWIVADEAFLTDEVIAALRPMRAQRPEARFDSPDASSAGRQRAHQKLMIPYRSRMRRTTPASKCDFAEFRLQASSTVFYKFNLVVYVHCSRIQSLGFVLSRWNKLACD